MSERFDIENFPTSESALKMLGYVSDGFYDNSYVGKWLFQVMGLEHDSILEILETLPDQMFPETATWGLMYHEIKWGLPIRENLSYEERRRLIYQKRDYRAPMTPHRMEVVLSDLSGCRVYINDIHSLGEDGYVPEHPNCFRVTLDAGTGSVDLGDVLQKLKRIKQSHTTFTFRVAASTGIQIGVEHRGYKVLFRLCGTYPKVSHGWKPARSNVEIEPAANGAKSIPPLSGQSGNAGQYPKTSHGLKVACSLLKLDPQSEGVRTEYAPSGEGVAGTVPELSTGYGNSEGSLAPRVTAEGFRVTYPMCGSAFEI